MIEQSILQYLSLKSDHLQEGGIEMFYDEMGENVLVQGEGEERILSLRIFSTYGRLLVSFEDLNMNEILLNLEDFSPGNYEIHLQTDSGWKRKNFKVEKRRELAIA